MINWDVINTTREEHDLIARIVRRAINNGVGRDALSLTMDLELTHGGTPLRLADMLGPDALGDMLHDVSGIVRHLDRNTGKLGGCFLPRFAV